MTNEINPQVMDKIVSAMIGEGLITADQVAVARVSHEDLGEDLGHILVKKGFVTEQQILRFLGRHLSIPYVSLKKYPLSAELAKELPLHLVRRHHLVPLKRDGATVIVAMSDPLNLFALEEIRQALKAEVRPVLASAQEIDEVITRIYGGKRAQD